MTFNTEIPLWQLYREARRHPAINTKVWIVQGFAVEDGHTIAAFTDDEQAKYVLRSAGWRQSGEAWVSEGK